MGYEIYALCRPDGSVFYIGQSKRTADRFQQHLQAAKADATPPCYAVIREILDKNEMPTYKILDTAENYGLALVRETELINEYGIDSLTNVVTLGSALKRFTLYLEPSLFEKLRTLAFNKRVSVAELIRQAVEAFLEEEK